MGFPLVCQRKLYINNLHEDFMLREYIKKKLKHAGVAKIEMEKAHNKIKLLFPQLDPVL